VDAAKRAVIKSPVSLAKEAVAVGKSGLDRYSGRFSSPGGRGARAAEAFRSTLTLIGGSAFFQEESA